MSEPIPAFAVVGRVNKGKSSIVSTLVEDEAVRIDRTPGTTQDCESFELRVGNRILCRLIDTPGFEEAPACPGMDARTRGLGGAPAAGRRRVRTHVS
jgi:GTP-binding protein EngB required for normal cell division